MAGAGPYDRATRLAPPCAKPAVSRNRVAARNTSDSAVSSQATVIATRRADKGAVARRDQPRRPQRPDRRSGPGAIRPAAARRLRTRRRRFAAAHRQRARSAVVVEPDPTIGRQDRLVGRDLQPAQRHPQRVGFGLSGFVDGGRQRHRRGERLCLAMSLIGWPKRSSYISAASRATISMVGRPATGRPRDDATGWLRQAACGIRPRRLAR